MISPLDITFASASRRNSSSVSFQGPISNGKSIAGVLTDLTKNGAATQVKDSFLKIFSTKLKEKNIKETLATTIKMVQKDLAINTEGTIKIASAVFCVFDPAKQEVTTATLGGNATCYRKFGNQRVPIPFSPSHDWNCPLKQEAICNKFGLDASFEVDTFNKTWLIYNRVFYGLKTDTSHAFTSTNKFTSILSSEPTIETYALKKGDIVLLMDKGFDEISEKELLEKVQKHASHALTQHLVKHIPSSSATAVAAYLDDAL
ncbi:MAG: hypothetical protein V4489_05065 [Chlamydiota bacterium]